MEKHYHAKDIIDVLKKAKDANQPVYQAGGPCGGCDLIIGPKEMPAYQGEGPCGGCDIIVGKPKEIDMRQMLTRLEGVNPLEPVYPGKGPCFGCDVPPIKRNE